MNALWVNMSENKKLVVDILKCEKPLRVPPEVQKELKGTVSGKLIAAMKKEKICCPIENVEKPFLICFTCKNFHSRVKGKVYCSGLK
ncbi:MAG: hypothetical protein ABSB40_10735 [Nitrososphaeria archaeon]